MIQYKVRAEIVDISNDTPTDKDQFIVDTNIWYWFVYSKCSQCLRGPYPYQSTSYPTYINSALNCNSIIYHSPLSLAELSHLIEKAEYEIFSMTNQSLFPNPKKFNKNFRHLYHSSYNSELIAACQQVVSLSSPLPINLDSSQVAAFLQMLTQNCMDGYDLYILQSMKNNNVSQIITDDGDYATIPDIKVFTANINIINAAKSCGKLISR